MNLVQVMDFGTFFCMLYSSFAIICPYAITFWVSVRFTRRNLNSHQAYFHAYVKDPKGIWDSRTDPPR